MSEERQRGVDLFNQVWGLMESREDTTGCSTRHMRRGTTGARPRSVSL